ncbi:MAG: hydantoinase/oxoprolinase family protein [Alphaproteobacteria bacterium]
MTARQWRVGVDIGGTFTDVIALDPTSGTTLTAKVRSRPGDPLASLRAALAARGLGWEDVAILVHGTTLVTNAIVEDRLPAVALVATQGFADVLAIGRQNRRSLYSLSLPPKLPPMVPEALRFELKERMGPDGKVKILLEAAALEPLVEAIRRSGVSSVAVSLLHAYANPAHERIVGDRLAAVVPHVSLSHRVNPEEREYERTSATVLNAAAMPLVGSYLDELDREVPEAAHFHLFHSAGGMASTAMVRERPLVLALSGPAAGVSAARQVARELALDNVLTLDMGGTTTDVCLIRHGKPERRREASLADRPVRQTMVAVQSIGAGGGSIAYVEAGMLRVGPQSAGASPGPVCYGLGGTEPTVTDANLMLGYLDAKKPLADGVRMDLGLAEAAIGRLARHLSLSPIETALGILRVANANMVRALRNVTVDRGIDGRRCTLVAFGGAGPLHAATLARDFGIRSVVVPAFSSAYSALGCAVANLSYTQQRTVRMASGAWSHDHLAQLREELLAEMKFDDGDGTSDVAVEDTALVRYVGQSYSVEVPYRFPPALATLTRDFRAIHEQLYGFSTEEDWELEAIRVTASVDGPPLEAAPPRPPTRANLAPSSTTPCWFSAAAAIETPRYRRDAIMHPWHLSGPAIVEDEWSTITLPPGTTLEATAGGHLVMSFDAAP